MKFGALPEMCPGERRWRKGAFLCLTMSLCVLLVTWVWCPQNDQGTVASQGSLLPPCSLLETLLWIPLLWFRQCLSFRWPIRPQPQTDFQQSTCTGLTDSSPKMSTRLSSWSLWVCYLTLQEGLWDVIQLRILRWRDYPGLLESAQCHHKSPYGREAGGSQREDVRTKAEVRKEKKCYTAGCGGRGKEPWGEESTWPQETGKTRKCILPRASGRNAVLPMDPF